MSGCLNNVSLMATGVYTSRNISWFDTYGDGGSDDLYTTLAKIGGGSDGYNLDLGECSLSTTRSTFSWSDTNTWRTVVDDEGEIIKGWRTIKQGTQNYTASISRFSSADPNVCCQSTIGINSKYSYMWNYPEMQMPAESCQGGEISNSSCAGSSSGPANCNFVGMSEKESRLSGPFTISNVYSVCNDSALKKIKVAEKSKEKYNLFEKHPIRHPYINEYEIIVQYFNFIPVLTTHQKDSFERNYLKTSGKIFLFLYPNNIEPPTSNDTPCCGDNFPLDRIVSERSFEFEPGCFNYVGKDLWENKKLKQDFIINNLNIDDQFKYDSGFDLRYCVTADLATPITME